MAELDLVRRLRRFSQNRQTKTKPKPPHEESHAVLVVRRAGEEAARFYVSLLPDSQIDRVTRWPADTPGGPAGEVLTVEFTFGGTQFVALNGPKVPFTEAVSFQIACADQAEVDRLWRRCGRRLGRPMRLAQGSLGGVLEVTPTRLLELIADPDPNRARRAMEAMMKMSKINIAEVEHAADGA